MRAVLEDRKDGSGKWVKSCSINGESCATKSYRVWGHMNERCIVGGAYQKRFPSYIGCTVSENFKDFQFFAEWHTNQIGYGLEGYELDKDILVRGNKQYSEHACVIIPFQLNSFSVPRTLRKGAYAEGVRCARNKFMARVHEGNTRKFLGNFETEEEASAAYKIAKEAEAYRWYERLKDGEFVVDPRVIERMRTWTFEEQIKEEV